MVYAGLLLSASTIKYKIYAGLWLSALSCIGVFYAELLCVSYHILLCNTSYHNYVELRLGVRIAGGGGDGHSLLDYTIL